MPAPVNQTLSFLKRRFEESGIFAQKRLGQNFLIDTNLQNLLVRAADIQANDVVLEVGTGTGSLTVLLAKDAAAVVTVEIDPQLFQLAGEELRHAENVTMLQTDILKKKSLLSPEVLETVERQLQAEPGRCWKLAANLPFNVATPILTNLLTLDAPPRSMTVTIQKELGDRIVASPGNKDYGALSIWVQSQCQVETIRVLSPAVFWPRPKVYSAIIRLTLDDQLRARIPDRAFFHTFVRSMFFHRRKFLRSELLSAFKGRLGKPEVDAVLQEMDLPPNTRAEQLDVQTMLALCETVRAKLDD